MNNYKDYKAIKDRELLGERVVCIALSIIVAVLVFFALN